MREVLNRREDCGEHAEDVRPGLQSAGLFDCEGEGEDYCCHGVDEADCCYGEGGAVGWAGCGVGVGVGFGGGVWVDGEGRACGLGEEDDEEEETVRRCQDEVR